VNIAGLASVADWLAGVTVAPGQDRVKVTLAPLFGTKSLLTLKVALFSVFVIVQLPLARAAEQVPEDV
jgi:hypothetical protein